MNRRDFLKTAGLGTIGAGTMLATGGLGFSLGLNQSLAQTATRPLPLIPMMDFLEGINERISLTLQSANHDFGNGGVSQTFGINNDYLGPVIRVKQGLTLPFDVTNNIDDVSTLHFLVSFFHVQS